MRTDAPERHGPVRDLKEPERKTVELHEHGNIGQILPKETLNPQPKIGTLSTKSCSTKPSIASA